MSPSEQDKKEQVEKTEEQPAQEKVPQVKSQEEKPAGAKDTQAQKEATPEKPKVQEQPKPEEQTNCLICNKPIKKLTRYYRNGKFYCGRKCWRTAKEKAKKESQKT
ncbi:MAG: hypothetical protein V1828_03975 [Candidatus Omnitrophota bacterium]